MALYSEHLSYTSDDGHLYDLMPIHGRSDPSRGRAHPATRSKLQAASGASDDALASARRAADAEPASPAGAEQLASLHADAGDTVQLNQAVDVLVHLAPDAAPTLYYAAVAQFLHGNAPQAMLLVERGIGLHPRYAPSFDLAGAVYTKLGQVFRARWAFNQSLSFDAHDSTAYENLGLLALEEREPGNGAQLLCRGAVAVAELPGGAGRYRADALLLINRPEVQKLPAAAPVGGGLE